MSPEIVFGARQRRICNRNLPSLRLTHRRQWAQFQNECIRGKYEFAPRSADKVDANLQLSANISELPFDIVHIERSIRLAKQICGKSTLRPKAKSEHKPAVVDKRLCLELIQDFVN
jgi:hypothetical protein